MAVCVHDMFHTEPWRLKGQLLALDEDEVVAADLVGEAQFVWNEAVNAGLETLDCGLPRDGDDVIGDGADGGEVNDPVEMPEPGPLGFEEGCARDERVVPPVFVIDQVTIGAGIPIGLERHAAVGDGTGNGNRAVRVAVILLVPKEKVGFSARIMEVVEFGRVQQG